nr:MAG TPA: hypothetical protein [Bacteriophage sp.]
MKSAEKVCWILPIAIIQKNDKTAVLFYKVIK